MKCSATNEIPANPFLAFVYKVLELIPLGAKAMTEVTIRVAGMSCGGCVRNVTGVLKALSGVDLAEVSLEDGVARVAFDPAQVSVEQLRGAIEAAGFDSPT